ncbi:hypothetical protein [Rhizobacter sp. OV335]|uniref:hypothetical protein n=1 Tax=Rhizobacter sp. OV335 TaxID=1500264 RepID=UPI001161545A|nr:hypothetical protein [Rhizobacter sp. OV335]
MRPKLSKLPKFVRKLAKTRRNDSAGDDPGLQKQFSGQRSGARVGLNPFDLMWTRDEGWPMTIAVMKARPDLPAELLQEIFLFTRRPTFLREFGFDLDSAREVRRVIAQRATLKDTMSALPGALRKLSGGDLDAPDKLRGIEESVLNDPHAPALLKQRVQANVAAMLEETDLHRRFAATSVFAKTLEAFGIT